MAQILSEGGVKPTPWNIRGPRDPRIREEWRWAWEGRRRMQWVLWEGGGTIYRDVSGSAQHLIGDLNESTPGWVGTRYGPSLDFTVADASSEVASDSDVQKPTGSITLCALVKNTELNDTTEYQVIAKQAFGSDEGYLLAAFGDSIRFRLLDGGANNTTVDAGTLSVDTWHALIGVWNGSTMRAYIDGVEVGSASFSGPIEHTTTPVHVGHGSDSTNVDWVGEIATAGVYPFAFTPGQVREWTRDPFGPFRPRERDVVQVLTAGTTVTVGQATETDTAQSVGSAKSQSVGQSTETDSAFSVTAAKTVSVGQSTETDAAQAVTAAKAQSVGLATETDASLAAGAAKAQSVGLSTETDSALAVTVQAGNTISVGQATETDTAQAVSSAKSQSVGQASESDLALSVTPVRVLTLGQASEVDTAQAVDIARTVAAGLAVETDQSLAVQVAKLQTVGQATETDTALAVTIAGAPLTLSGPFTMFGESLERTMTGEALTRTMNSEDADRTMSGEE